MIKFFRKIRQYAITEKKLSKYLIYAIGEIILVVIGILIALQIDNLNEQSKQDAEEIRILENLKKDLLNDISQLETNLRSAKERQVKIDSVFQILHSPDSYKADKFLNLNFAIAVENHFELNSGTFDESMAAGTINTIKSNSLRQQIFDYYRVAKINYTDNNTNKQIYENIIPEFFRILVPSKEFISGFLNKPTILPNLDIEALAINKDYVAILVLKYRTEHHQIIGWEKYLEIIKVLSKNIEEELETL